MFYINKWNPEFVLHLLLSVFQGKRDAGEVKPPGWDPPQEQVSSLKPVFWIRSKSEELKLHFWLPVPLLSGLKTEEFCKTWKLCWTAKVRFTLFCFWSQITTLILKHEKQLNVTCGWGDLTFFWLILAHLYWERLISRLHRQKCFYFVHKNAHWYIS